MRVIVLGGMIHYLNIGADYEFSRDFTIREIFRENRNENPREKGTLVHEASERDFRKAIGYLPTNR